MSLTLRNLTEAGEKGNYQAIFPADLDDGLEVSLWIFPTPDLVDRPVRECSLSEDARTSKFLAAGTMEWQEGPALPVEMTRSCAITATSFLAIKGGSVRADFLHGQNMDHWTK